MTPSIVWPRRSAALYTKTGIASGVFLRDAQDFLDRREPLARTPPSIQAQRHHAGGDGVLPDVAGRRATQHQAPRVFRNREELVDPHAPAIAGAAAVVAALAAEEPGVVGRDDAEGVEVGRAHLVRHATGSADPAHEPLHEDGLQHRGHQVGLHAHILKPRDRRRRVVRVQRREDEVTGERGLDRDFRGFQIANLPDEDDVGVLPHDDGLAVHGRNRRDADVDASAVQVDADAPVLRQPALGDVHFGHDLDAGGDGGLQAARRRLLIVEDAVDAIPDAQRVLERLDVDVGGLGRDRVLDEQIDEPHDRRLEGHVAHMVDVFVTLGTALLVDALDDALQGARVGAVVVAIDGLEDAGGGADDELHAEYCGLTTVVLDDRVARVRRGDREHATLDADRTHAVLTQILGRDGLEHRHGGRQLLTPDVGQDLLHGEGAGDVVLVQGADGDETLADELTGSPLPRKGAIDGGGGGEAFSNEDLAKETGRSSNGHAMLAPMLAYLAFAAVAAAADVAGAAIVTRAHKHGHPRLRYFVAGGAGFMLAAAFVRMLPESTHVPHAFLFVLLGYFGVHLFEHTVAPHFHFC